MLDKLERVFLTARITTRSKGRSRLAAGMVQSESGTTDDSGRVDCFRI